MENLAKKLTIKITELNETKNKYVSVIGGTKYSTTTLLGLIETGNFTLLITRSRLFVLIKKKYFEKIEKAVT